MAIDSDKLHEFLGKALVDFGATFNAALIRIGDRIKALLRAVHKRPRNSQSAPGPWSVMFASG